MVPLKNVPKSFEINEDKIDKKKIKNSANFMQCFFLEKFVGPLKNYRTSRSQVLLVLRDQLHFELALRPALASDGILTILRKCSCS